MFKFFWVVYLCFIAFTVIGTLSHELGHYAVARYFGYPATIHYRSTSFEGNEKTKERSEIYQKFKYEINNRKPFSKSERFALLIKQGQKEGFFVTLGGPVQTLFTGTLGLFLLYYRHRFRRIINPTITDCFCIFLALFWLRQTANLFTWYAYGGFFYKFRRTGDELALADYLHLPSWSIIVVTGILGTIIANFVLLNYLPKAQIKTFYCAGILGGISGYVLWLRVLGPIIIP